MTTMLAQGAEYELEQSGDGASYVLRFKSERMTAYIQGEDADRFRGDYAAIKEQYPAYTPDQMLAQLWDQGGYSWLAQQDEG